MKRILFTMLFFSFITFVFAQNVNIPDANFKAYLVGNTAINTNGDSEISVAEAQAFSGEMAYIVCQDKNISDLTGIEAFVNLKYLDCSDNQITSLDVSSNTALQMLYCMNNQITSLDVSSNTALKVLNCSYNQLTSLDVSNNTNLKTFYCYNNSLISLNLKNGNNSNFTDVDLKNNPNLYCVKVDDASYSNTNWSNKKDGTTCFSENCPIANFSQIPSTICQGDTFMLPTMSDNGVVGTWTPYPSINTTTPVTETYTFTTSPNQCAENVQIKKIVTVQENTLSAPIGPSTQFFYPGQTLSDLNVSITSGSLLWYANSSLTAMLPASTSLVNYTTYYAVSSSGVCKSDAFSVNVTQKECSELEKPIGEENQVFTQGQTLADLDVTGIGLVFR